MNKIVVVVVKYGGHAMTDEQLKRDFAKDIVKIKESGMQPVIVHGGCPHINEALKRYEIVSEFSKGMRITDKTTMDVVEMVLCGRVNKSIVADINREGKVEAVGISGKDANLVSAEKLVIDKNIDLGFVGQIKRVNTKIIDALIKNEFVPVIAPIGIGEDNLTYNINADIVAGGVAAALEADQLILLTDVDGVIDSKGSLIPLIKSGSIKKMIEDETITAGMIPKIDCALHALKSGVKKVRIINGKKSHALYNSLFVDNNMGTLVEL